MEEEEAEVIMVGESSTNVEAWFDHDNVDAVFHKCMKPKLKRLDK